MILSTCTHVHPGMCFQKLHTALAMVVHNFNDLSAFTASFKRLRDLQLALEKRGYPPPVVAHEEGSEV